MPICDITGQEVPFTVEHHIIPRERGGIDGPTVFITATLHDAIHRAEGNPRKQAKLLDSFSPDVRERVQMLLVALDESAKQLDRVNKMEVTIKLNEPEFTRLQELAREMSWSVTKTATFLLKNLLK
jgi:hypothetical protein